MSFYTLARPSTRLALWKKLLVGAVLLGACSSVDSLTEPGSVRVPTATDSAKSNPLPPDSTKTDSTTTDSTSSGPLPAARVGYFAAPGGSGAGDGSVSNPWDLQTALAGGSGRIQPGDTLWLRGGTYVGTFTSTLTGIAGLPVVVRQLPGERAIIDAAGAGGSTLQVRGPYSVFWGFEVTNSDPNRVSASTGHDDRPNTVVNNASHTKYIHLTIHDGGVGFYNYPSASDVEVYGTVAYNNGWQGPDRGHGHALYVKSDVGPVELSENVLFNQFGYGVHAYSNAGSGNLLNIRVVGNISFNNGTISANSTSANILVGGGAYASGAQLRDNATWLPLGSAGSNVRLGYGTVQNGDVSATGNYFVGGATVLDLGYWSSSDLRDNTLVGQGTIYALNNAQTSGVQLGTNSVYRDPASRAWRFAGAGLDWAAWQLATGLGGSDQVVGGVPTSTQVRVRPSRYEPGRANIIVYNWAGSGSVDVDLTGVVPAGSRYEVRNVQDLFGAPVASGTYSGGAVTLPLAGVRPPAPTGMSSSPSPGTGTEFHVFVVSVTQ